MQKNVKLRDILLRTSARNLFLAPSSSILSSAQVDLIRHSDREYRLKNCLATVELDYDYIIIDCPPSLNLLTINALTASSKVIVTVQTHYYSLDGMRELFDTMELVKEKFNPQISIMGVLPTLYDHRIKVARSMLLALREHFKSTVFDTVIRINSKLIRILSITPFSKNLFIIANSVSFYPCL